MANWIDKVTSANFLPSKDNGRFYVFSKQFNALVDKVNTLLGRGTVTQATSITTAVTLNKRSGIVTTVSSTLAANAEAEFTVNNSFVESDSVIILTGLYNGDSHVSLNVKSVADGSFVVVLTNSGGAALNATVGVQFLVL
jgi:hypothetical protein